MNWKIDYNNADIALQQTKFGLLPLKYRNGGMRMARKILIVDDEPLIVKGLKYSLEQDNYETDSAMDGEEALNKFFAGRYDLVLLDVMLPKVDGIEVLRTIRAAGNKVPVLLLTAKSDVDDKVAGLDCGADDYLTKPFSVDELLARLRVTVRRLLLMQTDMTQNKSVFENGDLKIDYAAGCAYLKGEELHLTPIEYKLLCLLSRNVGKVLTHTYITQQIWGRCSENDVASLRVFMATLRKKLEPTEESPQYIQTHIGVGYRMIKVN